MQPNEHAHQFKEVYYGTECAACGLFYPHGGEPWAPEPEEESEGSPTCTECGEFLEWEDCDLCGGEGGRDGDELMEEDPLWYGPDDYERCEQCKGSGGWLYCPNAKQHEEALDAA